MATKDPYSAEEHWHEYVCEECDPEYYPEHGYTNQFKMLVPANEVKLTDCPRCGCEGGLYPDPTVVIIRRRSLTREEFRQAYSRTPQPPTKDDNGIEHTSSDTCS